jgi:hypothetical protein
MFVSHFVEGRGEHMRAKPASHELGGRQMFTPHQFVVSPIVFGFSYPLGDRLD